MIVRCKKCGSTNIQVKYWCNPNTFKIIDVSSGEENDCWCENCQEETNCEWIDNQNIFDNIENCIQNMITEYDETKKTENNQSHSQSAADRSNLGRRLLRKLLLGEGQNLQP